LLFAALAIIVLFFDRITEFTISPQEGVHVKVGEAREQARTNLEAAIANRGEPDSTEKAARVVDANITPEAVRQAEGRTVLWVDDHPDNNILERKSLEALGLRFVLSLSTEDALEKIDKQKFDLIISDMGRRPDRYAGYTLLEALRNRGDQTPFVLYMGQSSPQLQTEARDKGAQGLTDRPDELFQLVTKELRGSTSRGKMNQAKQSQRILISHRAADQPIAEVIRKNLSSWGFDDIHQAGTPEARPRVGEFLPDELTEAFDDVDLVILVYTLADEDWSWCMWACGLATRPQQPDATRVVVFRCSRYDAPRHFAQQVIVDVDIDGIHNFTKQLYRNDDFFKGRPAYRPRIADANLQYMSKVFYEDLRSVIPDG
jgi:CheY-like chemotaxis protein